MSGMVGDVFSRRRKAEKLQKKRSWLEKMQARKQDKSVV